MATADFGSCLGSVGRMGQHPTGVDDGLADHAQALYGLALSITRDPHLASDLVQDTMVRAIERADQFRGDSSKLSWLKRILYNIAVDRGRKSAREVLVDEVEDAWMQDDYTVDPQGVAEQAELRSDLEDALLRLPFTHRSAVVLHDVEQWKVREIAEIQGISLPAAKQRLRRGRMALVTALAEGAERKHRLKTVPMRCWDARAHVSDYLDGELDARVARTVEEHLEVCPTCPPLYMALVSSQEQLGALRDPDSVLPPDVGERVREILATR